MSVKHEITVRLTGTDGNAFSIIANVAGALRRQVGKEASDAFTVAAFDCQSYDELLALTQRTVHVV